MKTMKKLYSLLIVMAIAVTMIFSIIAGAEEATYKLTLKNTDGKTEHSFEIYQIFTGDLSIDETTNKAVLSNIKWGNGVTSKGQSTLGDAATKAETITTTTLANSFAKSLVTSNYLTNPTSKNVVAGGSVEVTGLSAGYYLVKDAANTQEKVNGEYTMYIMEVVGDAEAETKLNVPSVTKKVKDRNDTTGTTTDWQDSADFDLNDSIDYQVTGTVPSTIASLEHYYYEFSDTMSKGLTYTAGSATITIDGVDVTTAFGTPTSTTKDDGSVTYSWHCDDIKTLSGVTLSATSKVVLTYSCTLNTNAVVGSAGNPNTVKVIYSNSPDYNGNGNPTTGETPEDKNIVFTYNVVVNKVDENNKALTGANFTLYKGVLKDGKDEESRNDEDYTWTEVGSKDAVTDSSTTFKWNKIDDGVYKLVESTVPSGYNKMDDIIFTVAAQHDVTDDDPKLTSLTGTASTGSVTFAADNDKANLSTTVVNKAGSTLPSTGGMGTRVIYILGVILVLGGGVLLITRKRMAA